MRALANELLLLGLFSFSFDDNHKNLLITNDDPTFQELFSRERYVSRGYSASSTTGLTSPWCGTCCQQMSMVKTFDTSVTRRLVGSLSFNKINKIDNL